MKTKKFFSVVLVAMLMSGLLLGCDLNLDDVAGLMSDIKSLKEELVGVPYNIEIYDNYGEITMTASGEKVILTGNIIQTIDVDDDGDPIKGYELSSVVTITMDGNEIENCGNTMIFAEKGLEKDVDFSLEDIQTTSKGKISDNTAAARLVNKYKNYFGKSRVVMIQTQFGTPICAYSGNDVYFEICENIPKTTKLLIDGKVLYIHRANYVLQDTNKL